MLLLMTIVAHALEAGDPCLSGPEKDVAQIQCLEPLFAQIVTIVASLAGVVFFIMLLVGGFRYLFSGGDPKTIEAAKGTLTAAFLGIVLLVSAYIILRLVASYTGLNQLLFFRVITIPNPSP